MWWGTACHCKVWLISAHTVFCSLGACALYMQGGSSMLVGGAVWRMFTCSIGLPYGHIYD